MVSSKNIHCYSMILMGYFLLEFITPGKINFIIFAIRNINTLFFFYFYKRHLGAVKNQRQNFIIYLNS